MQYFDFLTAVFASRASLYFKVCVAAVRHKKQCKGKQILDMTTYSYCGLATNYCAVIVVFFTHICWQRCCFHWVCFCFILFTVQLKLCLYYIYCWLHCTNYSMHHPVLSCLLLFCSRVELQFALIIPNIRREGIQPWKLGWWRHGGAINTVIKVC